MTGEDERAGPVAAAAATLEDVRSSIVDLVPGVLYARRAQEDRFTDLYVSPSIEEVLGASPREWLARPRRWEESIHPDDRDRVVAEVRNAVGRRDRVSIEYRLVSADGGAVWVCDTAAVVAAGERVAVLHGVMTDVTRRRLAEEALEGAVEALRLLGDDRRNLVERLRAAEGTDRSAPRR